MSYPKAKALETAQERFAHLMADVDNLLHRLERYDSGGAGGPPSSDERPLLRSSVLLIYAAWEVYVEESLVQWATALSLRQLDKVPEPTRAYLAEVTKDPWELAGEGWRTALVKAVRTEMQGEDDNDSSWGMNTASPKNVNTLHRKILGYSPLNVIRWRNQSNAQVRRKIAAFVKLRGEIAHSGTHTGLLWGQHVKLKKEFIERVTLELDSTMEKWLRSADALTSEFWEKSYDVLVDYDWHASDELREAHGIAAGTKRGREFGQFLRQGEDEGVLEMRFGARTSREYRLINFTPAVTTRDLLGDRAAASSTEEPETSA